MNQYDLNRAVAEATQESVGTIADLGFSLLAMPPTYPLAVPVERRKYPLRVARETRKRKSRRRAKSLAKSVPAARSASRKPGAGANGQPMPLMRLAFFDRGA